MTHKDRLRHIISQITLYAYEIELDLEKLAETYKTASKVLDVEAKISEFMTAKKAENFGQEIVALYGKEVDIKMKDASLRALARQLAQSSVNESFDDEGVKIRLKSVIAEPEKIEVKHKKEDEANLNEPKDEIWVDLDPHLSDIGVEEVL